MEKIIIINLNDLVDEPEEQQVAVSYFPHWDELQKKKKLGVSNTNYAKYLFDSVFPLWGVPWMTLLIIGINIAVYYLMLEDAYLKDCEADGYFTDQIMYDWQATTGYSVGYQLEVWRLALCGYVHADYDHIYGNMTYFLLFGILIEWQVGPWHVFNMFNFINVFGNVSSLIVWPDVIGIGASTALYGFIGAVAGASLKQKYGMRSEFFWT